MRKITKEELPCPTNLKDAAAVCLGTVAALGAMLVIHEIIMLLF